jgi:hypothetical protein
LNVDFKNDPELGADKNNGNILGAAGAPPAPTGNVPAAVAIYY